MDFSEQNGGAKEIKVLMRDKDMVKKMDITVDPIVITKSKVLKPSAKKIIETPDDFKKEFGVDVDNVLAVNGEFVRNMLLNPDGNMGFLSKHLFISDTPLQEGDTVLPEQAIFLILFHHLYFIGVVEGLVPLFSKSFADKYKALMKNMPKEENELVISAESKKIDDYVKDLQKDFASAKFNTWKSLLDAFKGEPIKILELFKKSVPIPNDEVEPTAPNKNQLTAGNTPVEPEKEDEDEEDDLEDLDEPSDDEVSDAGPNDNETIDSGRNDNDVNEDLDEMNTIEKLNEQIGGLYEGGDEDKETKKKGTNLENFDHKELYMMVSSGNENDCLIHTFLTAVSENFRKLDEDSKIQFAQNFRNPMYLKIAEKVDTEGVDKNAETRITSAEFLTDVDIVNLSKFYKLNILVFEDEKQGKMGNEIQTMPRCITFHENGEDADAYMFYGNNSHYESVRNASGYTIPYDEAKAIEKAKPCEFHEEATSGCEFDTGDAVEYKKGDPKGVFYVISRKSEDEKCKEYRITSSKKDLDEYMKLPQAEQDSTKTIEKYGPIVVSADELQKAEEKKGGTRKKRKPVNRTRKTKRF